MVHYQLTKDGKHVNAVLATFVEGYNLKERKDALTEAIKIRLGEGEAFEESQYSGRWKLIDFRLILNRQGEQGPNYSCTTVVVSTPCARRPTLNVRRLQPARDQPQCRPSFRRHRGALMPLGLCSMPAHHLAGHNRLSGIR